MKQSLQLAALPNTSMWWGCVNDAISRQTTNHHERRGTVRKSDEEDAYFERQIGEQDSEGYWRPIWGLMGIMAFSPMLQTSMNFRLCSGLFYCFV